VVERGDSWREEDGDVSGDKGVVEERGGDKEAVEPGGPEWGDVGSAVR